MHTPVPLTRPPSPRYERLPNSTVYRWSERQFITTGPFTSSSLRRQQLRPTYSPIQFLAELSARLARLALEQDAEDIRLTLEGIHLDDFETDDVLPTPRPASPVPRHFADASTQTEPPTRFLYATSDRATFAIDTTSNRVVTWAPRARVPYNYTTARHQRTTSLRTAGATEGVTPTNIEDIQRARHQASAFSYSAHRIPSPSEPSTPSSPSDFEPYDTTSISEDNEQQQ